MNKKIFIGSLLVSMLLTGCARPQVGQDKKQADQSAQSQIPTLTVGYQQNSDHLIALLYVAEKKGFFENNHVKVVQVPAKMNVDQLLASGQIDVDLGGMPLPLTLYMNGTDIKWLADVASISGYGVSRFEKKDSAKITRAAVVNFGGYPQLMTDLALTKLGADTAKIKFVSMPDDQGKVKLLDQNQIDFTAIISGAVVNNMKLADKYHVFQANEVFTQPVLDHGLFVKQETLTAKSEALQGLVKAVYQAMDYIVKNPNVIAETPVGKATKSPEAAKKIGERIAKQYKLKEAFLPNSDKLQGDIPTLIKEFKIKQPSRVLDGFAYTDFAAEAIK